MSKAQELLKSFKADVSKIVNEQNLNQLRGQVKKFIKTTQNDLNKNLDIESLKNLYKKEKVQLEKMVDKVLTEEIKKAKKFVNNQKKELESLQKKLDLFVAKAKNLSVKNSSVRKKTAKKTAKKATKKATATSVKKANQTVSQ